MIVPSWLGRFETPPAKVDALGKVGQRRADVARLAQDVSPGVRSLLRDVDLTRVLPSELEKLARALCKDGAMSLDVYYRFRDATRDSDGRPRAEIPFDFLREVRDGTRQVRAMARRIGSLQPEKIYAEFSMSARGLNYLAAAIKGVKAIDIRA